MSEQPGIAIIWHETGSGCWYWHVIDEVLFPADSWKAYCDNDGCRYGLDGAWVRDEPVARCWTDGGLWQFNDTKDRP